MAGPSDVGAFFGNIFPSGSGGSGGMGYLVLPVAIFIILIAAYLFLKKNPIKSYPVMVKVNEHLKNGDIVPSWTKGRSIGKLGEFQQYELANGEKTAVPGYVNLQRMGRGFFLELDKFDNGRYIPHDDKFVEEKTIQKIKVIDPDTKQEKEMEMSVAAYTASLKVSETNWLTQTIKENIALFQENTFWKKHGIEIVLMILIFASLMLVYVSVQYGVIPILDKGEKIQAGTASIVAQFNNITDKWIAHEEYQDNIIAEIVRQLAALRGVNATIIT